MTRTTNDSSRAVQAARPVVGCREEGKKEEKEEEDKENALSWANGSLAVRAMAGRPSLSPCCCLEGQLRFPEAKAEVLAFDVREG